MPTTAHLLLSKKAGSLRRPIRLRDKCLERQHLAQIGHAPQADECPFSKEERT
jgi:hypothetical protein